MSIQGKEILVVDDVADVRMRCKKILENLGMIVSEAESGSQALQLLSQKTPHLIILDLQMPGMSGFEFLSIRKDIPNLALIPVVVSSSLTDKPSVYKAISLGANDYVLKPLNASTLSQKVRKHIRGLDFKRYKLKENEPQKLSLHIGAQITKLEETSFILESPVRLEKISPITLSPATVKNLDLSTCLLVTSPETGVRGISGRYVSKVNVVGINETLQKKVGKNKS